MTFQYLLLAVLGLFLVYVLAMPRQALLRKGFVLLFVITMLVFTAKPEWSTALAQMVGISRGVDLLFYLSHLVLFFIAFMYYLKFKDVELRLTTLVRNIALDTASGHTGRSGR